ncbi:MAG TPA: YbdD/YjiX family protein [Gemmatimonadales bacterium]|nr:YbdD/YjiX family protein [Gemmatimonadales bacterium]
MSGDWEDGRTGGSGTPDLVEREAGGATAHPPHHPSVPLMRRIATAVRRMTGMPDYPAYLEHLRRCHPERAVPSEKEFFEEYLRSRYAGGPTRCC